MNIQANLSVNKSMAEAYNFVRKMEEFPRYMEHISQAQKIDDKTTELTLKISGGMEVLRMRTQVVMDTTNEHIGFQTSPGSPINAVGNIKLSNAGKFGTVIHISISYTAPAGDMGKAASKLLNPAFEKMVKEDLRNMKRYLETGEIPTIEGQPKVIK